MPDFSSGDRHLVKQSRCKPIFRVVDGYAAPGTVARLFGTAAGDTNTTAPYGSAPTQTACIARRLMRVSEFLEV
jgi:hypothetical protein